jgi:hypothetical protein
MRVARLTPYLLDMNMVACMDSRWSRWRSPPSVTGTDAGKQTGESLGVCASESRLQTYQEREYVENICSRPVSYSTTHTLPKSALRVVARVGDFKKPS